MSPQRHLGIGIKYNSCEAISTASATFEDVQPFQPSQSQVPLQSRITMLFFCRLGVICSTRCHNVTKFTEEKINFSYQDNTCNLNSD